MAQLSDMIECSRKTSSGASSTIAIGSRPAQREPVRRRVAAYSNSPEANPVRCWIRTVKAI